MSDERESLVQTPYDPPLQKMDPHLGNGDDDLLHQYNQLLLLQQGYREGYEAAQHAARPGDAGLRTLDVEAVVQWLYGIEKYLTIVDDMIEAIDRPRLAKDFVATFGAPAAEPLQDALADSTALLDSLRNTEFNSEGMIDAQIRANEAAIAATAHDQEAPR